MDILEVRKAVQTAYELKINFIEKIKNVYKIYTSDNQFCLKIIRYDFGHFLFIISAIKHLQNNGFKNIPEIIKTQKGMEYIEVAGSYAYLTKWITSRECNYDNSVDILIASSKLAELHKKSRGFEANETMNPRVGWFKWIEVFKTRRDEILDFKRRIYKNKNRSEFDNKYLSMMKQELARAEMSIENLIKSPYLDFMNKEIINKSFCHHDYANHNVLVDSHGEINIIDFDYCILDTHIHDLASLIIRRMKNGKWNISNALFIIQAYSVINEVKKEEIPIMAGFMEFPQDYWQVGIQYYWEKQPWDEEFFMKKLKKIDKDRNEKQEFINDFRTIKI
ncbi:CotS family spore coat protein [Clostridiaceae bacterium UIB06]|nr:CotS family spore coat protein [Clostridiaceae bacterium UIB06]